MSVTDADIPETLNRKSILTFSPISIGTRERSILDVPTKILNTHRTTTPPHHTHHTHHTHHHHHHHTRQNTQTTHNNTQHPQQHTKFEKKTKKDCRVRKKKKRETLEVRRNGLGVKNSTTASPTHPLNKPCSFHNPLHTLVRTSCSPVKHMRLRIVAFVSQLLED